MRCSSCEPMLDAYLEASLRGRKALDVTKHLRECGDCAALLQELRIIDALLTTARAPGRVASDFTAAVVSAAAVAPTRSRRRVPLWLPLLAYLTAAWTLTALVALRSNALVTLAASLAASEHQSVAALGAAMRALAPATPLAAAAMTGVLLLDLLLLCAIVYGYRRMQPLLGINLTRGSRS